MLCRRLFLAAALCLPLGATFAADISLDRTQTPAVLTISGPIEQGDFERFHQFVGLADGAKVRLASPGGLIVEALQIGHEINQRRLTTAVFDQDECASACSLIWLAGTHRQLSSSAKLGFHAVYNATADKTVSSDGNALVGAYLARMGYNDLLVGFATHPAPDSIHWLSRPDVSFLGIEVEWLDNPNAPKIVEQPTFDADELDAALVGMPLFFEIKRQFPGDYDKLLVMLREEGKSGKYWGKASSEYFDANLMPKVLATATPADAQELMRLEYENLKHIASLNKRACAAYGMPDAKDNDTQAFQDLSTEDYASGQRLVEYRVLARGRTASAPSKRDQAWLVARIGQIRQKYAATLGLFGENKLNFALKHFDQDILCSYHLFFAKEFSADPRLSLLSLTITKI